MSDPARARQEVKLTTEEVERILRPCGPCAFLVGGQGLAVWAVHNGNQSIGELSRSVIADVDFVGTNDTARATQQSLSRPLKFRKATSRDAGKYWH